MSQGAAAVLTPAGFPNLGILKFKIVAEVCGSQKKRRLSERRADRQMTAVAGVTQSDVWMTCRQSRLTA